MYLSDELFQHSREDFFWCLFPELQSNEGNKHQNDTRVNAETVRHESTYIILFLARHNKYINDDNKANLRDLISATRLVILLKFDPNHRFFSPCDLEI